MVLVNRIIFLILLSLFKYCGASILVESRGYRVERRGVGVFIHLLILFLGGGKGEQRWRLVWLGKILRKRILKGILIALDRD